MLVILLRLGYDISVGGIKFLIFSQLTWEFIKNTFFKHCPQSTDPEMLGTDDISSFILDDINSYN